MGGEGGVADRVVHARNRLHGDGAHAGLLVRHLRHEGREQRGRPQRRRRLALERLPQPRSRGPGEDELNDGVGGVLAYVRVGMAGVRGERLGVLLEVGEARHSEHHAAVLLPDDDLVVAKLGQQLGSHGPQVRPHGLWRLVHECRQDLQRRQGDFEIVVVQKGHEEGREGGELPRQRRAELAVRLEACHYSLQLLDRVRAYLPVARVTETVQKAR
mmetsp:Transcript_20050/g.63398  ORF Transcript_20050/g.63398 Transcript_20050/m.63398 type:complete len:215 (+) Transcript_20050:534-1178(+)